MPLSPGQLYFGCPYFLPAGCFGKTFTLTPSLVVLLYPATTHLDGVLSTLQSAEFFRTYAHHT